MCRIYVKTKHETMPIEKCNEREQIANQMQKGRKIINLHVFNCQCDLMLISIGNKITCLKEEGKINMSQSHTSKCGLLEK